MRSSNKLNSLLASVLCLQLVLAPVASAQLQSMPPSLETEGTGEAALVHLGTNRDADQFGKKLAAKAGTSRFVILHFGEKLSKKVEWIALHLDEAGVEYEIQLVTPTEVVGQLAELKSQIEPMSDEIESLARELECKNTVGCDYAALVLETSPDGRAPGKKSSSLMAALTDYLRSPLGATQLTAPSQQTFKSKLIGTAKNPIRPVAQYFKNFGLNLRMLFGLADGFTFWIEQPRTKEIKAQDRLRANIRSFPTSVSIYLSFYAAEIKAQAAMVKAGTAEAINYVGAAGHAALSPEAILTTLLMTAYVWVNGYWTKSLRATMNQGKMLIDDGTGTYKLKSNNLFSWGANFFRGMITNVIFIFASSMILPWDFQAIAEINFVRMITNAAIGTVARAQIDKWISDHTPKKAANDVLVIRPGQFSERTASWLEFSWGIGFGLIKNLSLMNLGWVVDAIYTGLAVFNVAWTLDEKAGSPIESGRVFGKFRNRLRGLFTSCNSKLTRRDSESFGSE